MKTLLSIILLAAFQINLSAQNINKEKSVVNFEVGNMIFNTVEGSFAGMTGTLSFNSNDLSNASFNVCIDAATVKTDNEERDNHLKNDDFFEVEKYPTICFKSTQVTKEGANFIATGLLTMHGVTKTVSIPFTFLNKTFVGELELNRMDYLVGEDTGSVMVSEDIELVISAFID
jgi:polyisoprenoid-binding protein YceI